MDRDPYQVFAKRLLLPLILWRGDELARLRYLREFERTQYLPAEEIRELQWQRLKKLLHHAYNQCPFYRERFELASLHPNEISKLDDLANLPPLDKNDIQAQNTRMVAENWPKDDLIRDQTGGSTGQPISFVMNRDRYESRVAAMWRHDAWAGLEVGHRTAYVWGAPRDLPSKNWKSRLRRRFLGGQLWLDTACITEEKMYEFDTSLKAFRPRSIVAYANGISILARFFRSQGITPYQPYSIITSAEVLTPENRALVEGVFGCPVFNRYGSREVSVIASECEPHGGMLTMAEGLYVEVEQNGRPAHAGEIGEILITDLLNFGMPIIRYRIGDMGSWAEDSDCSGRNLPRLKSVEGRVTDFVTGDDGRLVSGVFLATYVVACRPSLGTVQLWQNTPGTVVYRIRRGSNFREIDDLEYLRAATKQYLGSGAIAEFEYVEEFALSPSGKLLFCRSEIQPDYCAYTSDLS
jgi:phenylacetate-CoA ligase